MRFSSFFCHTCSAKRCHGREFFHLYDFRMGEAGDFNRDKDDCGESGGGSAGDGCEWESSLSDQKWDLAGCGDFFGGDFFE